MVQTYHPVTSSKMTTTTILCAILALTFSATLAVPLEQEKAVEIIPAKESTPESPQSFAAGFKEEVKLAEQPEATAEVRSGSEPADLAAAPDANPSAEGADLETANTFWGYPSYGYNRGYGGGWRRGWGGGWGGGYGGWGSGYGGYGGWGGYNRGYGGWGGHGGYGGWGGRGFGGGWNRGWGGYYG